MNEKSFSNWLQDVAEQTARSDGETVEACVSFDNVGLPGSGFMIQLRDGEIFEVKVSQIKRAR
jgi:hypothetical protein